MSYQFNKTGKYYEIETEDIKSGGTLISCRCTKQFYKMYKKTDNSVLKKLNKQINRILLDQRGKPMSSNRKGTLERYMSSFRIYFEYSKEDNMIILTEFSHKDNQ